MFDFMLIHGNKQNRFIENEYEKKSIKLAEDVNETIRQVSSIFFKENKQLVKNSVLPPALQYLIETGDVI